MLQRGAQSKCITSQPPPCALQQRIVPRRLAESAAHTHTTQVHGPHMCAPAAAGTDRANKQAYRENETACKYIYTLWHIASLLNPKPYPHLRRHPQRCHNASRTMTSAQGRGLLVVHTGTHKTARVPHHRAAAPNPLHHISSLLYDIPTQACAGTHLHGQTNGLTVHKLHCLQLKLCTTHS